MPDITMCNNNKCPLRWHCVRSASSGTEPCSWRQSYSHFAPVPIKNGLIKCEYFVLAKEDEDANG